MAKSKAFKVVGIGCAVVAGLVVLTFAVFLAIGMNAPSSSIYVGHQVPAEYMETIRSLDLLEEGETLRYLYSDAFLDLRTGIYFVTDRHLVVYSSEWAVPETIIPLGRIASVTPEYDESFFIDSMVYVTTHDGLEVWFPLSSEYGLDRKFVALLEEGMTVLPAEEIDEPPATDTDPPNAIRKIPSSRNR